MQLLPGFGQGASGYLELALLFNQLQLRAGTLFRQLFEGLKDLPIDFELGFQTSDRFSDAGLLRLQTSGFPGTRRQNGRRGSSPR